eukprot:COSAG01_NODE_84_length_27672_cov_60.966344_24_plen_201_part_00
MCCCSVCPSNTSHYPSQHIVKHIVPKGAAPPPPPNCPCFCAEFPNPYGPGNFAAHLERRFVRLLWIPLCPRSTVIILETVRDPTKPDQEIDAEEAPELLKQMAMRAIQEALYVGAAPLLDEQRIREATLGAETITHYDGRIRYKSIAFPYPDSAPNVSCTLWLMAILRCVWCCFIPCFWPCFCSAWWCFYKPCCCKPTAS